VRVVNVDENNKRISLEPSELPESADNETDDWRKYRKDNAKHIESPFDDL